MDLELRAHLLVQRLRARLRPSLTQSQQGYRRDQQTRTSDGHIRVEHISSAAAIQSAGSEEAELSATWFIAVSRDSELDCHGDVDADHRYA